MNPELLLSHFDRISDTPEAIPRLRRFILNLAVRGRLVEQDPKDEPASELLKRIQAEKDRLAKANRSRRETLPSIDPSEIPFHVPRSWAWMRVGWGFEYDAGIKREPRELLPDKWLLELEDIEKDSSVVLMRLKVQDRESRSTKSEFRAGDILYGKLRPYLNKVVVADVEGYSTTEIVAIRPFIPMSSSYCSLAFRSPDFVAYVSRVGQGTKMPRLRTQDALVALFPLPPLAEQHRIAAKVDELMALCDRLAAARNERENRRDRLATASLHRLNSGANSASFREYARSYVSLLPRLTTRAVHIRQLRQTLLDLAVRGKLVPQDSNEESVSHLLRGVRADKELIDQRGSKRESLETHLSQDEAPFALPSSWQWVPFHTVIVFGPQNGISPKPSSRPDAPRAITLTATTKGVFDSNYFKQVDANIPPHSEFWLRPGDLLFQRGNTREYVGIAAYYTGEPGLFLYPDLMMKVRLSERVSLRYVHLCAMAPHARAYFSARASGAQATMPKINQGILLKLPIPLPPLAEQMRIVSKIDELMGVCDRLEKQLIEADGKNRGLLEAVLHHALNDASEAPPTAAHAGTTNVDSVMSAI